MCLKVMYQCVFVNVKKIVPMLCLWPGLARGCFGQGGPHVPGECWDWGKDERGYCHHMQVLPPEYHQLDSQVSQLRYHYFHNVTPYLYHPVICRCHHITLCFFDVITVMSSHHHITQNVIFSSYDVTTLPYDVIYHP